MKKKSDFLLKVEDALDEANFYRDNYGDQAGLLIAIEEGMKLAGFKGIWLERSSFTHPIFKNRNWNERIVYWYIYYRSNDEMVCNSFNKQIANELGISEGIVDKIIPQIKKSSKGKPALITTFKSKSGRRYIRCLVKIKLGEK